MFFPIELLGYLNHINANFSPVFSFSCYTTQIGPHASTYQWRKKKNRHNDMQDKEHPAYVVSVLDFTWTL